MFDEASLKVALAEIGYRRLKRHVYRGEWSTEIEHFLYFRLTGTPKEFISANFGIRTKDADAFAHRAITAYEGEIFRLFPVGKDPDNCVMRFTFGQLASWSGTARLYIPAMSGPALAAKIQHDIARILVPVVRQVTTLDRFLGLALSNTEFCPWVGGNGAMRAAVIIYVARQLGAQPDDIRAMLAPYQMRIEPQLRKGREPDPGAYIEKLIADADASLSPPRR
jgi:hypothetical protein